MNINTPLRACLFYLVVTVGSVAFVFGSLTMVACSDFSTFTYPECLHWAWTDSTDIQ